MITAFLAVVILKISVILVIALLCNVSVAVVSNGATYAIAHADVRHVTAPAVHGERLLGPAVQAAPAAGTWTACA